MNTSKKAVLIAIVVVVLMLCAFDGCMPSKELDNKPDNPSASITESLNISNVDRESTDTSDSQADDKNKEPSTQTSMNTSHNSNQSTDTGTRNDAVSTSITSNSANSTEPTVSNKVASTFSQQSITTSEMALGYWLYTPRNPESNMPLILYLHGGTGKGSDLNQVVYDGFPQYLKDGLLGDIPAYVIIPQLPSNKKGWTDIKVSLIELIDHVRNTYQINPHKICLTGHSMGGTGTWGLALAYPKLFSCIVPMSGSIKNTEQNRAILSEMPIWAFVGSEDTIVDPLSSISFINDLKRINHNVRIAEIDGATHFDVPSAYLSGTYKIINWMLSQ